MVAKSSHILYILFWDDWDSWVKYYCFGVMGKNINYYPHMCINLKKYSKRFDYLDSSH
jgi:hypothetical protein